MDTKLFSRGERKYILGRVKTWTEDEIDYMQESWGRTSITTIAKNLERSVSAIQLKAQRVGLTRHLHSGEYITLAQLIDAIGKRGSYSWYKKKWLVLGLPVKKHKVIKKNYLVIDTDVFWEWAEKNKDKLDFSNFEENMLGMEPDWVKTKRSIEYREKFNKVKWCESEDSRLLSMLKQYRYTYDDICRELNRTEGSIKRRISTLGFMERPIRHYVTHWTDIEVDKLLEMEAQGHCFEIIGRALNRSGSAVRAKFERIQNPDWSKRWYRRQQEEKKLVK